MGWIHFTTVNKRTKNFKNKEHNNRTNVIDLSIDIHLSSFIFYLCEENGEVFHEAPFIKNPFLKLLDRLNLILANIQ